VIGWHATPLAGRRVFRLTYRSAKTAGLGKVSVQLTGDHPVLAERGFVPVEALVQGERIATGQGLSRLAHDVVCGTVLGDGHLNAKSAHLIFGHSERQADYARFKAHLLAELAPREAEFAVAAVAGGEKAYPVIHVRTLAHRALGILRTDFYAPEKRVPAWIEERLNDRMLAIWFMDDGHLRVRPPRQPSAEIAAVGVGWCFVANAVSFLAVLASLALMRVSELFLVNRRENPTIVRPPASCAETSTETVADDPTVTDGAPSASVTLATTPPNTTLRSSTDNNATGVPLKLRKLDGIPTRAKHPYKPSSASRPIVSPGVSAILRIACAANFGVAMLMKTSGLAALIWTTCESTVGEVVS